MRAFVISGPNQGRVEEVTAVTPGRGEVVVAVEAAGLCGTDRELFDGSMPYISAGLTRYPFTPGHEWAGTVVRVGGDTSLPVGTRVTGDVFIPCNACPACAAGRINTCPDRYEIGVRGNWPGAVADEIAVPERIVHRLPDGLAFDEAIFAEPGVTSLHAIERCGLRAGERCLVYGSGTLALIAIQIAGHLGADVACVSRSDAGRGRAIAVGAADAYGPGEEPAAVFDVVIEAAGSRGAATGAVAAARAGGRIGIVGIASSGPFLDANDMVLRDLTIHGAIGGPGRFPELLRLIASGAIRTEPLVRARIPLDEVAATLSAPLRAGDPPKTIVKPALPTVGSLPAGSPS